MVTHSSKVEYICQAFQKTQVVIIICAWRNLEAEVTMKLLAIIIYTELCNYLDFFFLMNVWAISTEPQIDFVWVVWIWVLSLYQEFYWEFLFWEILKSSGLYFLFLFSSFFSFNGAKHKCWFDMYSQKNFSHVYIPTDTWIQRNWYNHYVEPTVLVLEYSNPFVLYSKTPLLCCLMR